MAEPVSAAEPRRIEPARAAEIAERLRHSARRFYRLMTATTYCIPVATVVAAFFYLRASDTAPDPSRGHDTATLVLSGIGRIGVIVVAIYLMQFLANFTRYGYRIADHLDATADAIELCAGDPREIPAVLEALSPRHIGFGKPPAAPSEVLTELLRDRATKRSP